MMDLFDDTTTNAYGFMIWRRDVLFLLATTLNVVKIQLLIFNSFSNCNGFHKQQDSSLPGLCSIEPVCTIEGDNVQHSRSTAQFKRRKHVFIIIQVS